MKKARLLALVLVTMCVSCGALAVTAAAEITLLAEWLSNGTSVTTLDLFTGVVELLSVDRSNKAHIVCSYTFVGSVGPSGEDEITEVLSLAGVLTTLAAPLLCTAEETCESSTTDVEVVPEELPWHGVMYLAEATGLFLLLMFKTAYALSCLVLGIKITDECTTTEASVEVKNVTSGVEEKEEAQAPLGTCSIGGTGTYEVSALSGNLWSLSGATLSVSE